MSKHIEAVVERTAHAICDSDYPGISWALLSESAKNKWRRRANAALDAAFGQPIRAQLAQQEDRT